MLGINQQFQVVTTGIDMVTPNVTHIHSVINEMSIVESIRFSLLALSPNYVSKEKVFGKETVLFRIVRGGRSTLLAALMLAFCGLVLRANNNWFRPILGSSADVDTFIGSAVSCVDFSSQSSTLSFESVFVPIKLPLLLHLELPLFGYLLFQS